MIKGSHHTKEAKERIAETTRRIGGRPHTEEAKRKIGNAHRGKVVSVESREKMSTAKRGVTLTKSHRKKISEANKGNIVSAATKKKISKANKTFYETHDRYFSKETRKKISEASKRNWQDTEYQEKQLKAIFAGHILTPNKPEKRLRSILNKLFPKDYKFVGDGKTFIGGKCPDFININGQKKLIEMFGDYWHSKAQTGLKKKIHRQQRQDHFRLYGFETCVVWQKELKDIPKLKNKLRKFHGVI